MSFAPSSRTNSRIWPVPTGASGRASTECAPRGSSCSRALKSAIRSGQDSRVASSSGTSRTSAHTRFRPPAPTSWRLTPPQQPRAAMRPAPVWSQAPSEVAGLATRIGRRSSSACSTSRSPAAFDPMAPEIWRARKGPSDLAGWYQRLLAAESDPTDPHPPVAERLARLGIDPQRALALAQKRDGPSALDRYLPAVRVRLIADLDRGWQRSVAPEWAEQYRQAQDEKAELARLDRAGTLSVEQRLQRALLTETFHGADAALTQFRELVDTEEDGQARLAIGRLLLAREDDEGLLWLDQAAKRDWQIVLPADAQAYSYLREHGRDEEAEAYERRLEHQVELLEAAEKERSEVTLDDWLDRPDLPIDQLELVRDAVAAESEVAAAYLARKHTHQLNHESPFYVLGVVPRSYKRATKGDSSGAALAARLADAIPDSVNCLVVTLHQGDRVTRRLARIEGASLLGETK